MRRKISIPYRGNETFLETTVGLEIEKMYQFLIEAMKQVETPKNPRIVISNEYQFLIEVMKPLNYQIVEIEPCSYQFLIEVMKQQYLYVAQ